MGDGLPPYVVLARGEQPQVLIQNDWQVHLLTEALFAVLILLIVSLAVITVDLSQARALAGVGGNLFATLAFLTVPVLVQRLFGKRQPYVLANMRLIVNEDKSIPLHEIRRIKVWMTSIMVQTDTSRFWVTSLINAPAVARLIRDATATYRRVG